MFPASEVVPERTLMVSILLRAFLDYYSNQYELREDATRWIFEEENEREVFSFLWICSQLGLSPTALTQKLRTTHEMKQFKIMRVIGEPEALPKAA